MNNARYALLGAMVWAFGCSGGTEGESAPSSAPPPAAAGGVEPELREPFLGYPPTLPGAFAPDGQTGDKWDPDLHGTPPAILSVEPAEGHANGGEIVTIHGSHFSPEVEVTFGDVKAADLFYIGPEWLNVTTPPMPAGKVDLRVINHDGLEAVIEDGFRFYDTLEVQAVVPAEGPVEGGTPLTIVGTGFGQGALVLIGDRLALQVAITSATELHCVAPPGDLGPADVRVLYEGEKVAALEDAFRYVGAPIVSAVWPLSGPTIGGTEIAVTGSRFTPGLTATLGGKDALVKSALADSVVLVTPGGPAGAADLVITTPDGATELPSAFTYLAPSATLKLWSVSPPTGKTSGGDTVSLVVQGLLGKPTIVTFDGAMANVVKISPDANLLTVETPAGTEGLAGVAVQQGGVTSTLDSAFLYVDALTVTAVSPAVGSPAGGEALTVSGEGLDAPGLVLAVGALPATALSAAGGEHLSATAPPCSPGLLDVTATVGAASATLPKAFECRADGVHLYALDPPEVSEAGGALVLVIGANLSADVTVTVGGEPATDLQLASPTALWMRAPRGVVGPADVVLTAGDVSLTLPGGLTYADYASKKQAVFGGPIARTIDVTIFNGSSGKRLAGATAILGTDPSTPDQCVTDDRGQCTISRHGLTGPQQITAAKNKFSAYTISGFNGRHVNMIIRQQGPPSFDGPPGTPGSPPQLVINELTGLVSGKVSSIGKYVVLPPGDCQLNGSPDGQQCTPCDEKTTCPGALACAPLADTGSWCVASCESSDDCLDGFACANLGGGDTRCIPHPGTLSTRCETSRRNFFGSNPDPGPGADVDPVTKTFSIASRLGEITVYCVGGYTLPQTGQFVPVAMGIKEHVYVNLFGKNEDVDLALDIPLTRKLRARVFDLPAAENGITSPTIMAAVDIGAEGWIPFNSQPTQVEGERYWFAGYPETLEAFGKDASYTFYNWVTPQNMANSPSSYVLIDILKDVDGDPLATRDAATNRWGEAGTGMKGDLHALWGSGEADVWGVGPRGRLVHKGPLGWGPQPSFTQVDLHDVWGTAQDDVWAAGDKGTILHFDGVTWTPQPLSPKVAWTIRSLRGEWAVGDGGILRNVNDVWVHQDLLHDQGLRAVTLAAGGLAVAVGEDGKVLTFDGSEWTATTAAESGATLNAVWSLGAVIVAVGDRGAAVHGTISGKTFSFTSQPAPITLRDLHALGEDPDGVLWAAGTAGTVLRLDDATGAWVDESNPRFARLDYAGLWSDGAVLWGAGVASLPIGPWMAFPDMINPTSGAFIEKDRVEWTFDGGPRPTFNALSMSSSDGFVVWAFLAAGDVSRIDLPPLSKIVGYDPITLGTKYFNQTRALNPEFDIDDYRFAHTSMWLRTTWSSAFGYFY